MAGALPCRLVTYLGYLPAFNAATARNLVSAPSKAGMVKSSLYLSGYGIKDESSNLECSMPAIWGYALALAAGVSFVFQQAVNSNLRAEIGSAWWAGFISYAGGTLAMLLVALALRDPLPQVDRFNAMSWTGGIFGAIYIAISIFLLPKLGAATVIALIVAGQMFGSLAFDHFGLLSVPIHTISLIRLAGAALLVAGVVLIRI